MSKDTPQPDKPVYVSGSIHREAKARAAREGISLREVVERALRRELKLQTI